MGAALPNFSDYPSRAPDNGQGGGGGTGVNPFTEQTVSFGGATIPTFSFISREFEVSGVLSGWAVSITPGSIGVAEFTAVASRDGFVTIEARNTSTEDIALAQLNLVISSRKVTATELLPATSLLIPAYYYPADEGLLGWDKIIANPKAAGIVIINPNDGFFTEADPNFTAVCQRLLDVGVRMIGYVATGYGANPVAGLKSQIDSYQTFYGDFITGYFLDEGSINASDIPTYQTLHDYIKSIDPTFVVTINPGEPDFDEGYMDVSDIIVSCENTLSAYQDIVFPDFQTDGTFDPNRFCHLIHDVDGQANLAKAFSLARANNVGYLLVSDADVLPAADFEFNWQPATDTPNLPNPVGNTGKWVQVEGLTVGSPATSAYIPAPPQDYPIVTNTQELFNDERIYSNGTHWLFSKSPWGAIPSFYDAEVKLIGDTVVGTSTSPADSDGLEIWLESDIFVELDSAGNVAGWVDRQGGNEFLPSTDPVNDSGEVPVTVEVGALNGQPALDFSGNQPFLALSGYQLEQPFSVSLICKGLKSGGVIFGGKSQSDASPGAAIFIQDGGYSLYAGNFVGSVIDHTGENVLVTALFDGANSKIWVNGVQEFGGDPGTFGINDIGLGSYSNEFGNVWLGSLGAVIVRSGVLDDLTRVTDSRYLAGKYGLVYAAEAFSGPAMPILQPSGDGASKGFAPSTSTYKSQPGGELFLSENAQYENPRRGVFPQLPLLSTLDSQGITLGAATRTIYPKSGSTINGNQLVLARWGPNEAATSAVAITVRANKSDGSKGGAWEMVAGFRRISGVVYQIGSTNYLLEAKDDAAYDAQVITDGANIILTVQGNTGETISWDAEISQAPQDSATAMVFGMFSDNHGTNVNSTVLWFTQIKQWATHVISIGDSVDRSDTPVTPGSDHTSVNQSLYRKDDHYFGQYFNNFIVPYWGVTAPTSPFSENRFPFGVIGNHNVDDGSGHVDPEGVPDLMGFLNGQKRYGSVVIGNAEFFWCNSEALGEPDGISVGSKQYLEMLGRIRSSNAQWKFGWGHRPKYVSECAPIDYSPGYSPSVWPEFDKLLDGWFNGHQHIYEKIYKAGKYYFTCPSATASVLRCLAQRASDRTGPYGLSQITFVGTLATATSDNSHHLSTGDTVIITGATGGDGTDYNGTFTVTVIDGHNFTYTMIGTPGAPAAGYLYFSFPDGPFTAVSLTKGGTGGLVATLTTAKTHQFQSGDRVVITGATGGDATLYNVLTEITVLTATSFSYRMTGAPASNAAGTIKWVKFSGPFAVTSITRVATVATVTTTSKHYLTDGQVISIVGATGGDASLYNLARAAVTVIDTTHFSYVLASTPSGSAAGTIVFNIAPYIDPDSVVRWGGNNATNFGTAVPWNWGGIRLTIKGTQAIIECVTNDGTVVDSTTINKSQIVQPSLPAAQASPMLTGLTSYWACNEAAGATLVDSTGTNALTVFSGSPGTGNGLSGDSTTKARTFNGTTDEVFSSSNSGLKWGGSVRTLDFWMKFTAITASNQAIFGKSSELRVYVDTAGKLNFALYRTDGTIECTVTSAAALTAGAWTHISLYFDPSIGAFGTAGMLINNVAEPTVAASAALTNSNTGSFTVGALSGPVLGFAGSLDQIGLWGRLLTSHENSVNQAGTPYPFQ